VFDIVYSSSCHGYILDPGDSSLYVINKNNTQTIIDHFDVKSLSTIGGFSINTYVASTGLVDINCIYLISDNAELIIVDKFNGEIFNRIPLRSICSANMVQDNESIYILCVLPTKEKNISFTTYFVQKINKHNYNVSKFRFFTGTLTKKLYLYDNLYFADLNYLRCMDTNGTLKWENKFSHLMDNPLTFSSEHIVASSKKGILSGFSLKGNNLFNIQLLKSETPLSFGTSSNELKWISDANTNTVNIQQLILRTRGWKKTEKCILKYVTSSLFKENYYFLGNKNGQIEFNGTIQEVDKTPIIGIQEINEKLILVESRKNIHIVRITSD